MNFVVGKKMINVNKISIVNNQFVEQLLSNENSSIEFKRLEREFHVVSLTLENN